MIKCAYCQKEITDPAYKTYKRKRYHAACFAALQQKAETQDQQNSRPPGSDRDQLQTYLLALYRCTALPAFVSKQIDSFRSQYGYTCLGMRQALEYFYSILGNPVPSRVTIGIIPWCYDEAQAYFHRIQQANLHNASHKMEQVTVTAKIRPPNRHIPCTTHIEDL